MKFIIDINNPGRKYNLNLYTCHEYMDGSVSPDARIAEGDKLEEFLKELQNIVTQALLAKKELPTDAKPYYTEEINVGVINFVTKDTVHGTHGNEQFSVCLENCVNFIPQPCDKVEMWSSKLGTFLTKINCTKQ